MSARATDRGGNTRALVQVPAYTDANPKAQNKEEEKGLPDANANAQAIQNTRSKRDSHGNTDENAETQGETNSKEIARESRRCGEEKEKNNLSFARRFADRKGSFAAAVGNTRDSICVASGFTAAVIIAARRAASGKIDNSICRAGGRGAGTYD